MYTVTYVKTIQVCIRTRKIPCQSLQTEREISEAFESQICCTKKLIFQSEREPSEELRILGFGSCGTPYTSSHFSRYGAIDFVVHILVISQSKQTGEENSGIVNCSPSLLVKIKKQWIEIRTVVIS